MRDEIELNSNAGNFPVYVSAPDGEVKGGLVVIHEVWGLTDHIKSVADRFAREGYLVIAPNLLAEIDIPDELSGELQNGLFNPDPKIRNDVQPKLRELMTPIHAPQFSLNTITKLKTSFDYLMNKPETKQKIGVVGYCFGGTYSFTSAINEPRLKAAVPFYGHNDSSVEELKKITCPILAFYGENDEGLIGSLPDLRDRMKAAKVKFDYKIYQNCGHAFFNDTNRYSYNSEAATDAWRLTLEFLSNNLA